MVIWVFAGGGETEASGLIKFLDSTFPHHSFERKLPFNSRKTRAKPGKKPIENGQRKDKDSTFGITGESLSKAIKIHLNIALNQAKLENARKPKFPDLILVIDDLDCCNLEVKHQKLDESIEQVLKNENLDNIQQYIVFAAPEIESWIIADWDHTLAKSEKFRGRHERMRHWLSTQKKVPFDQPESFGEYNPETKACKEKLSNLLIEASSLFLTETDSQNKKNNVYKKSEDSPNLLLLIEKTILCQKCPIFRDFYYYLAQLTP